MRRNGDIEGGKRNVTEKEMPQIDSMEEVPQFETEAEEAEFWATHELSEAILNRMRPVRESDSLGQFMQDAGYDLRRIHLPRTPVNGGAGAWQPRLLLLFEKRLLLCQSASAAHTASSSARLSASKTTGLPDTGVCCALMDTVTERLPSALAAANWV